MCFNRRQKNKNIDIYKKTLLNIYKFSDKIISIDINVNIKIFKFYVYDKKVNIFEYFINQ